MPADWQMSILEFMGRKFAIDFLKRVPKLTGEHAALTKKGFSVSKALPGKSAVSGLPECSPGIQRVIFVLLVAFFSLGLWIGPQVSDDDSKYCVTNIRISKHIGQSASCDSLEFIRPANNLSFLLGPNSRRQDRPGIILLVHFIFQPLVWYVDQFQKKQEIVTVRGRDRKPAFTIPRLHLSIYYVGFLVVNFVVLRLSYILYLRAIGFSGLNERAPRGAN